MDNSMDQKILDYVGLPDNEATDLIQKHQAYLQSLSPAQQEVTKRSLPDWHEAAAAVGS